MSRRTAIAACVLACLAGGAALALGDGSSTNRRSSSSSATSPRSGKIDAPRRPAGLGRALVTVHGLTAEASVETYCASGGGSAYCADAGPLADESPVLPAAPAARAGVLLGHPARSLTASIARVESDGPPSPASPRLNVKRRGRGGRRWAVALPAGALPDHAALRFGVAYRGYHVAQGGRVYFDVRVAPAP